MKISFFVPANLMPSQQEQELWSSGKHVLLYPGGVLSIVYNWIYQTWFCLERRGFECELVSEIPQEGILIANSDTLFFFWRELEQASEKLFILNALSDSMPFPFAHFYISQNGFHAGWMPRTSYIPHWPYPRIIPRDQQRGDLIENIAFFGNRENLDPLFFTHQFQLKLQEELGLRFVAPDFAAWHDFSQIDLCLGVRSFTKQGYLHKPGSKLYNAWQGEVPFIAGNDTAYRYDGNPGHDYLIITKQTHLWQQLRSLKENPERYQALINAGKESSARFSQKAIEDRWINLLQGEVLDRAKRWRGRGYTQQLHFWGIQRMILGWDRLLRWPFYHPHGVEGIWSFILPDCEQLPLFDEEVNKASRLAEKFQSEGNQELSNRYLHIAKLIKQFLYLKSVYGIASEPPFIPIPPALSYLVEGKALYHFYLQEAKKAAAKNQQEHAMRWERWAEAIQIATQTYEEYAHKIFEIVWNKYSLNLEQLPEKWDQYRLSKQERAFAHEPPVRHSWELLEREIAKGITLREKVIPFLSAEKIVHQRYDALLSLYWQNVVIIQSLYRAKAVSKGFSQMVPRFNRVIAAAARAASLRNTALDASKQEERYRAGLLRKAAYWSANQALVAMVEVDVVLNGQLSFCLPKLLKKVRSDMGKAIALHCYGALPLLRLFKSIGAQKLEDKIYYYAVKWIDALPLVSHRHLLKLFEKHSISPDQIEHSAQELKNHWKQTMRRVTSFH